MISSATGLYFLVYYNINNVRSTDDLSFTNSGHNFYTYFIYDPNLPGLALNKLIAIKYYFSN